MKFLRERPLLKKMVDDTKEVKFLFNLIQTKHVRRLWIILDLRHLWGCHLEKNISKPGQISIKLIWITVF